MNIRKTTRAAIEAAAAEVGVEVELTRKGASRGGGETFAVKVNLTHGPTREEYRRYSPSGRRVSAVCWHGFRDFYRALYERTPEAVVKSAMATYEGAEHFEATYRTTAGRNIGSLYNPCAAADACECGGWE